MPYERLYPEYAKVACAPERNSLDISPDYGRTVTVQQMNGALELERLGKRVGRARDCLRTRRSRGFRVSILRRSLRSALCGTTPAAIHGIAFTNQRHSLMNVPIQIIQAKVPMLATRVRLVNHLVSDREMRGSADSDL